MEDKNKWLEYYPVEKAKQIGQTFITDMFAQESIAKIYYRSQNWFERFKFILKTHNENQIYDSQIDMLNNIIKKYYRIQFLN